MDNIKKGISKSHKWWLQNKAQLALNYIADDFVPHNYTKYK